MGLVASVDASPSIRLFYFTFLRAIVRSGFPAVEFAVAEALGFSALGFRVSLFPRMLFPLPIFCPSKLQGSCAEIAKR